MKHIVFGDVHANLEAFEAVIGSFPEEPRVIVCTGDTVDYGADPNECMRLLESLGSTGVLGNHDAVAIGKSGSGTFNSRARESVGWTTEKLSPEWKRRLGKLPLVARERQYTLAHGGLDEPENFSYILCGADAEKTFPVMDTVLFFTGHSHVAGVFSLIEGHVAALPPGRIDIKNSGKYIINPGSVGQPRDGDPRASYCVFDDESMTIDFRRIRYDIDKARRKILSAGLPSDNAERLGSGR